MPLSTAALETYVDLGRTRLEQMLKVLDVDGAVRRVRGGWVATGEPWTYDAERYARVSEARQREQQAMLDYLDTDRCRMWFLRDQLDDPAIAADSRCGRCDRCGGFDLPTEVSDDAVGEARVRLARPGVVVEPRTMWPTALGNLGIDLKGRIGEGAEPGRAVARLTDLGHGQALRELFGGEPHDGPVPESLVHAVIEVLQDWRPAGGGHRRRRVGDPAAADGRAGRRAHQVPAPAAGREVGHRRPGRRSRAGRDELRAARGRGRSSLPPRGRPVDGSGLRLPAGPVLLVDDQVVTGWTLTLAARALREAGATGVLPLTLAVRS